MENADQQPAQSVASPQSRPARNSKDAQNEKASQRSAGTRRQPGKGRLSTRAPRTHADYSTPVLHKTLALKTHQAQQVESRILATTMSSMYITEVVLRIIGDSKEAEAVSEIINNHLKVEEEALRATLAQLEQVRSSNMVDFEPEYSKPISKPLEVSSPQAMRFVLLLEGYDKLIRVVDGLWFAGLMDGKQKATATWEWQRRLVRLGNNVIALERRARAAAVRKNKGEEVSKVVGDTETATVSDTDAGGNKTKRASKGQAPAPQSEDDVASGPAPVAVAMAAVAATEPTGAGVVSAAKIAAAPAE
ncbi:DUF1845 domain-containing protein [Azospirillum sp. B21]|uniref:AcaB family transcriptional regulator n=1 Tax=unclassified Azospirillum TaxID=2630922 RepID=UPI0011EFABFB|nr:MULTISPECIES: AcaB family transcriptional regulator [unclassified Azospirillum]KAA0576186.1 DUF1845 domain-containing protein [Azospirillum sp. B21]MDR6774700.1 hypothetical protein [Azospirillum sp. BE72]